MSGQKAPIVITAQMIADSLTARDRTNQKESKASSASETTQFEKTKFEQTRFDQNDALALLVVQQQSMMKMMKKMVKQQGERDGQNLQERGINDQQDTSFWYNCVDQTKIFLDQIVALSRYVTCNPVSLLSSIRSVDCGVEQDLELGLGGDNY